MAVGRFVGKRPSVYLSVWALLQNSPGQVLFSSGTYFFVGRIFGLWKLCGPSGGILFSQLWTLQAFGSHLGAVGRTFARHQGRAGIFVGGKVLLWGVKGLKARKNPVELIETIAYVEDIGQKKEISWQKYIMSHEKIPWLVELYRGWETPQSYRDYNKPL